MKKYSPVIEVEPYTGAESLGVEEDEDGEYYKCSDVVSAVESLLPSIHPKGECGCGYCEAIWNIKEQLETDQPDTFNRR